MKQEFYQGKIKQYNPDKGFGFIGTSEGDVFFHISEYPAGGEPKRNEKVKFVVVENDGKYKATKIELVDPNPAKTRKTKITTHNNSITTELLSNFRR
ncbi:cold shock domain-containing protein [Acinetobacter dispersus]|uniref:cold shock domain-containing protein n=1 Tax=Acinetobacter dispersus TaxID=70348 RepID=UPI00132E7711|nr:cold shock domain-containing protein [Acinetobacter dispersus]QHH97974.1 cold shock domain-containing protein [Acinetobacter dispersus]